MTRQQVNQINQQPKGETSLVSGVLQRAAVRAVADKEVEGTQEVESGGLSQSRFVHDFTQVPIGRGGLPIIQPKLKVNAVVEPMLPTSTDIGRPLKEPLRQRFEYAFGTDLSNVRIHESGTGMKGVLAFTQGEDIYMPSGVLHSVSEYDSELIGHELSHVLQQRARRVSITPDRGGFNTDPILEREADELGIRAAQGERVYMPGIGSSTKAALGTLSPRQARFAVTISTNIGVNGMRVQTVAVVGRPDSVRFPRAGGGTTEGDHSTAWGVIRLGVTNRLRDQTLAKAFIVLDELVQEAQALPGAQQLRTTAMAQQRQKLLEEATDNLNLVKARRQPALQANDISVSVSVLQEYVAAYLKYRNVIGLVVMDRGQGAAGDGESRPLQTLQHWEHKWSDANVPKPEEQQKIVEAMGALFSRKVWSDAGAALPDTFPGKQKNENAGQLQQDLRQQHLASLKSAYPNLWTKLSDQQKNKIELDKQWNSQDVFHPAILEETGVPLAVQLTLDNAGQISRVTAAGRSKHGMGNSEGSHTTAYGLFERILNRLNNKTLIQAKTELDNINTIFDLLPGASKARLDRMSKERTNLFSKAKERLQVAKQSAITLPMIQEYAEALLSYRNTMGLVTISIGNVPGNRQEQNHLNALDEIDNQIANPGAPQVPLANILDAVVGLFDKQTLQGYADNFGKSLAPGRKEKEKFDDVFRALFKQHILTVKAAYPNVFLALTQPMLEDIANRMIDDYQQVNVNNQVQADGRLQHRVKRTVAPAGLPHKKRRKINENEDYVPGGR